MRKNKEGFTLAELLVVVAIIAILVAVSIPIFTGRLEAAKEATCLANRRSLKAVMANDYLNEEYENMRAAFTAIYDADKTKAKPEFVCPKDGVYSWEGSADSGHIKCSVHDGHGSGSEDEEKKNYVPNTELELVESYWPYAAGKKVAPGGTFQAQDGKYYVVYRDIYSTNNAGGPGSGYGGAVVQLTSTVHSYGKINDYKTVKAGDLTLYDGSYYVATSPGQCTSPGGWTGSVWYKIPTSKP